MAEKEEKKEETQTEPAKEEYPVPEKPQYEPTLIEKANEAAKRIEAANARWEKNIERQEALAVENKLAGQSVAGAPPAQDTDEEYAKKALRGEVDGKEDHSA